MGIEKSKVIPQARNGTEPPNKYLSRLSLLNTSTDNSGSSVFRPVVSQCVGVFDNLKFNFVADAGWHPSDKSTNPPQRKLHDTKAVAFLTPTPATSNTNPWRNVIENLHHVEGTHCSIGCNLNGLVESTGNKETAKRIKLYHTIFTYNYDAFPTPVSPKDPSPQPPNQSTENDDAIHSANHSDPSYDCWQFTDEEWRDACSYLTREAFDDMWQKGHHNIEPVPAYGLDGELIPPSKYRQELTQSVVHVSFVADHEAIGKKDNHYANMVKIQVLYKLASQSARKRPSNESDRVKALRKKLRK
ncbi:hypothetical protein BXZ70DRAFT_908203 [Cristinia sonorae]|uniref:Uncharacterized protein n=1 Tax=Cristinia sonorae TaxID=1940300 RepID=A0A8K0UKB2_9AGAR|nr:hypothetical protein BXZ70DRAFT_908203 [Cristinia sonorae]